MTTLALPAPPPYPVRLTVEHAERQSRWKALFRVILVIPAYLLVAVVSYSLYLVILVSWIIVLIRGRHPTWMFAFIVGVMRIIARVYAYFFLLTDAYVVFEGAHPLSLDIDYPQRVARWQIVIWKLITAFPHFVVLNFLYTAGLAISFVGWLGIVFGGSYPKGLHSFATGVLRWQVRVVAYVLSLTDAFPPYSIDADAGPGSRRSLIVSAIAGLLLVAAIAGGVTAAIVAGPGLGNEINVSASYEDLQRGGTFPGAYAVSFDNGVTVDLRKVTDPADPFGGFIVPDEGERLLMFEVNISNGSDDDFQVHRFDFHLVDSEGGKNSPIAAVVDNHRAPRSIDAGDSATVYVVFETGAPGTPETFRYGASGPERFSEGRSSRIETIVYEFE